MASPTTAAIDRVIREVVAPGLKPAGFRRSGRLWTHASDTNHRGLTVQRSRLNGTNSGRFTLNLRLAFLELDDEPFVTQHIKPMDVDTAGRSHRIGELIAAGRDHWWEITDAHLPRKADEFVQNFSQDWNDQVLPAMEAATDPQRLCAHLLNHATLRGVIIAFDYALRIGDPSLTDTVYNRALEVARQVEPWPLTPDGKWALMGTTSRTAPQARPTPVYQAWVQLAGMADRLGRQLEGADRDRALEALHWAIDTVPRRSSSGDDEMTTFATRLGVRHMAAGAAAHGRTSR